MYTTNEVAEILGVTPGRVHQLVTNGIIWAEKKGRDLLIPQSQIEKAKKRKTARGPAKKRAGK